jgi:DNA-nicking Smr family endonuclease
VLVERAARLACGPARDDALRVLPSDEDDEAVEVPITDQLDLHTFRPSEVKDLLPEYFHECRQRGLLSVRVIHGKGTGALREGVHRLLERLPEVASYDWPAGAGSGGWGATWVTLRAAEPKD